MKLKTAFELARVSNLPTVWTNVLVGAAFVGLPVPVVAVMAVALAVSAMYCGGMCLNDACDYRFDLQHRPERPIPRGQAAVREVWTLGLGLLVGGAFGCVAVAWAGGTPLLPVVVATALLCGVIYSYDRSHRDNPWAPWKMGLCRALVYAVAGLALGATVDREVVLAGVLVMVYVAGLTAVARFEVLVGRAPWWAKLAVWAPWIVGAYRIGLAWPLTFIGIGAAYLLDSLRDLERGGRNVGATVARLVAAISFVDVVMLTSLGNYGLATLACFAVVLCRRWQRVIAGT